MKFSLGDLVVVNKHTCDYATLYVSFESNDRRSHGILDPKVSRPFVVIDVSPNGGWYQVLSSDQPVGWVLGGCLKKIK